MKYQYSAQLIRKISDLNTLMCLATVEQRWRVIGEFFNQLMKALITAAYYANVCNNACISDSAGCISNDCKLDLVDIKENLHAQQYVDTIIIPP